MSERLQKLIATAGYGSRRWAERLIEQGRVEVNNKTASIGDKAEITDKVIFQTYFFRSKTKLIA